MEWVEQHKISGSVNGIRREGGFKKVSLIRINWFALEKELL